MIHPSPTELKKKRKKKGLKIITELFNNGCMLNNSIEKLLDKSNPDEITELIDCLECMKNQINMNTSIKKRSY